MSLKIVISAIWGIATISSTYETRSAYYRHLWLLELDSDNVLQVIAFLNLFLILMFLESLAFHLHICQTIIAESSIRIYRLILKKLGILMKIFKDLIIVLIDNCHYLVTVFLI